MTIPYGLTELALGDLEGIWDYVARDDLAAANRLLVAFEETFHRLADQPFMGRGRAEIRPGVRSLRVRSYVVYYQVRDRHVTILRVLHGARDIAGLV
jgi:toxin ParE1/3/4